MIKYTYLNGTVAAILVEPLAVQFERLMCGATPEWILWAWEMPSGDLKPYAMRCISEWIPVDEDADHE